MQDNTFMKLDRAETESLLQEINPVMDGAAFSPATAILLAQDLGFYPGYRFIEVADYEQHPPRRRYVIHGAGKAVAMNGENDPIYKLNEDAPIRLDESTVAEYVRFFFRTVRGRRDGRRFLIVETVDDIQWREEPPPAARKAIGKILTPLSIVVREADGGYRLTACLMFKDSLFKATVKVRRDGVIDLDDEELLIEGMPVIDDLLGQ